MDERILGPIEYTQFGLVRNGPVRNDYILNSHFVILEYAITSSLDYG